METKNEKEITEADGGASETSDDEDDDGAYVVDFLQTENNLSTKYNSSNLPWTEVNQTKGAGRGSNNELQTLNDNVTRESLGKTFPVPFFPKEFNEESESVISLEPLKSEDVDEARSSEQTISLQNSNEVEFENRAEKPVGNVSRELLQDREDISEEELDTGSFGMAEVEVAPIKHAFDQREEMTNSDLNAAALAAESGEPSIINFTNTPVDGANAAGVENETQGALSSDDGEIIDLKFEDAMGKSEDESLEYNLNRQSNGQNEELETVSDDELPEMSHPPNPSVVAHIASSALGGGILSISNRGDTLGQDMTHEGDQISNGNRPIHGQFEEASEESKDLFPSNFDGVSTEIDPNLSTALLNLEVSGPVGLTSLEAEPISDEEDVQDEEGAQDDPGTPSDSDTREAGEVNSPVRVSSPQPVQELLREVEPISADESSDTDGELPSGEEDSHSRLMSKESKPYTNFESIDSDEGDLGTEGSESQMCSRNQGDPLAESSDNSHQVVFEKQKKGTEYMETISDEESLDLGDDNDKGSSVLKTLVEAVPPTSPTSKEFDLDKRQVATNFNEHQVELDYEENDGEEGDGKLEELKDREDEEEGEVEEGGVDDKDEGELSDDDCEEGEIKEPGAKKPFIKPTCRFFQRGNCTWGVNCRFLHPGVNDKGNYQMIEIPGFKPPGARGPGVWEEQEELPELPPPPIPDIPPVETAWERGLRIAKEQRKKASERKEQEPDFEEKRLNLSVDEERELNKENERMPKIIPKDPYYDQQAYEEDEYYKAANNPWQTGHYENFEVRYHRENSFSPPYREKPPLAQPPPARYGGHQYSPPVDKFGRQREERREPFRPEPLIHDYPSTGKRPDEWTDPWRRVPEKEKQRKPLNWSKSPQKRKARSRSKGKRNHRSVSDTSNSSRSGSRSSSGSSHSSRSGSGSSGSSSRSRSPEPAPPGVDRYGGQTSPRYGDQPRSAVSVRGRGGYNHYDSGYRGARSNRGYDRGHGGYNQRGGYRGGGGGGGYYNNYNYRGGGGGFGMGRGGGGGGGYQDRDPRDPRPRDDRMGRTRGRSPPDRPLPYVRPRPKSVSSHSSSSRSRSRSRHRFSDSSRSRSRSSSNSSRSSSSSSSSAGSADSEHLYRDLGSPSKNPRAIALPKKKRVNSHKERAGGKPGPPPGTAGFPKHPQHMPPPQHPVNLDRIPHPRDPKQPGQPPPSSVRPEAKYASRNAPQVPTKAKDPLKVVGQKSNIKLTLLPKQQQASLGNHPNPLDSPPHKRRLSERDTSPIPAPAAKRLNIPVPQASALRLAAEKAAKLQIRQEIGKSTQPAPAQLSTPSSLMAPQRAKAAISPQKQVSSSKPRVVEPTVAKVAPKAPLASVPTPTATAAKAKKSMSSRREELLKQLKAVEDAIARKKSKLQ